MDRLLARDDVALLVRAHGRALVTQSVRDSLAALRTRLESDPSASEAAAPETIAADIRERVETAMAPSLRPVFNLTGTVLHTNLGRALLPEEAVAAMRAVAVAPSNLEFDIDGGKRGDRDSHTEAWLCRLTGAEAATVVNNNAAAVLLVLNTFALGKAVAVSRGELIEIGGAFRIPDIMTRSGCTLREVGTTNRTHLKDFRAALDPDLDPPLAMIMKVHASNYAIQGFTAAVPEAELAALCRDAGIPFAVDLGSGTLVDLEDYGLPHEPTPRETLAQGADIVTFSGDKLLGGPQAGIIVGRRGLIAKLKSNPLKRALRLDKVTIAALDAVLALYGNPDALADRLPTIRLLARPRVEIRAFADRLAPAVAKAVEGWGTASVEDCMSQIGSGALPVESLPSAALVLRPAPGKKAGGKKGAGARLNALSEALRALPVPVIGRIQDDAVILDLRCLEDEAGFAAQLPVLRDRLTAAR